MKNPRNSAKSVKKINIMSYGIFNVKFSGNLGFDFDLEGHLAVNVIMSYGNLDILY